MLKSSGVLVTYGQEEVVATTLSKAAFRDMYHKVKRVLGKTKSGNKSVNRMSWFDFGDISSSPVYEINSSKKVSTSRMDFECLRMIRA